MTHGWTRMAWTVLALVALSNGLLGAAPARAAGATQIHGTGFYDDLGLCVDPVDPDVAYALTMSGDLEGCWYIAIDTVDCSPSGTYREIGHERFVGRYEGAEGTFRTTYRFTAKYADCANVLGELVGRCQHPIVAGSGTGVFTGVSGRLDFKDDIAAGNFPYRGHLQWSASGVNQRVLRMATSC